MKKKNAAMLLMILVMIMSVMISGCGAVSNKETAMVSADKAVMTTGSYGNIYEAAPVVEEAKLEMPQEAVEQETVAVEEQAADTLRKLIRNVDMSVETEDFDGLMANIQSKVNALGGYIEQSDVYNGSYTSNYRSRNASLKVRIPSGKLDSFVDLVAVNSNITNKSESVEDVTLQYVDLESHKKALRAEEESLIAMLQKAEKIEDIVVIQSQLTSVRYQIESMESQLRTYDNKIQYSTVWLYVNEVAYYEPYEPKTPGQRIREGFTRNVHNVLDGIENFCIEFVIAIPLIIMALFIIAAGVGVLVVIIKTADKYSRKKKEQSGLTKKEKDKEADADK